MILEYREETVSVHGPALLVVSKSAPVSPSGGRNGKGRPRPIQVDNKSVCVKHSRCDFHLQVFSTFYFQPISFLRW